MHWAPRRYLHHTSSSICNHRKVVSSNTEFIDTIYHANFDTVWSLFRCTYKHSTRDDNYQNEQHLVAFHRWQKKQVTSWTGCSPNVLTVSQDLFIYKEWRVCAPGGRIQACGPLCLRWNRANSSWSLHRSTYEWSQDPLGCYGYRSLNNKVKPALTKQQ